MFEQYTVVTGKFLNNERSKEAQNSVSRSVKVSHIKMAFAEKVANVFGFPFTKHAFNFLYREIKETKRLLNCLPNTSSIPNRCA